MSDENTTSPPGIKSTVAMEAMMQRIEEAVEDLIKNVFDPDTMPTDPRKLLIEMTLTPAKTREVIPYKIKVTPKYAISRMIEGTLFAGYQDGQVHIFERNPNQTHMFDKPAEPVVKVPKTKEKKQKIEEAVEVK